MRRTLLLPLLASILAIPSAASAAHPKVDATTESCEGCHADATPVAYREWKESTHGIALVKCFVCHGSTGADFKRKPTAERCNGCHADQVASMRGPSMKGKTCFTCHSAHSLSPHVTAPASSVAAKLGADRLAPMVSVEGRIPPPTPAAPAAAPAGGEAAKAPAAAAAPGAAAPAPAAGPDAARPPAAPPVAPAEKDLTHSQPHPPTDR